MPDTPIKEIQHFKKEIHDLRECLNVLSTSLFELNRKTYKGTVSTSNLNDLPGKIKLLDRKMQIIYHSFELPGSWCKFSDVYLNYYRKYDGKDALDSDIEFTNAAKEWARKSEYFLDFLDDANLDYIGIEAVTQANIDRLESKYTSSVDESNNYKFELLMTLKNIIKDVSLEVKPSINSEIYVNPDRIEELKKIKTNCFDFSKLVRLCEELNMTYASKAFFSSAMLVRSILDHVPPIFGKENFEGVASQCGRGSLKKSLENLQKSLRNISDMYLHQQIRKKESLPNSTQIDFRADLDLLLGEIVRLSK